MSSRFVLRSVGRRVKSRPASVRGLSTCAGDWCGGPQGPPFDDRSKERSARREALLRDASLSHRLSWSFIPPASARETDLVAKGMRDDVVGVAQTPLASIGPFRVNGSTRIAAMALTQDSSELLSTLKAGVNASKTILAFSERGEADPSQLVVCAETRISSHLLASKYTRELPALTPEDVTASTEAIAGVLLALGRNPLKAFTITKEADAEFERLLPPPPSNRAVEGRSQEEEEEMIVRLRLPFAAHGLSGQSGGSMERERIAYSPHVSGVLGLLGIDQRQFDRFAEGPGGTGLPFLGPLDTLGCRSLAEMCASVALIAIVGRIAPFNPMGFAASDSSFFGRVASYSSSSRPSHGGVSGPTASPAKRTSHAHLAPPSAMMQQARTAGLHHPRSKPIGPSATEPASSSERAAQAKQDDEASFSDPRLPVP